jgi:large repetitive protein
MNQKCFKSYIKVCAYMIIIIILHATNYPVLAQKKARGLDVSKVDSMGFVTKDLSYVIDHVKIRVNPHNFEQNDFELWSKYLNRSHPSIRTLQLFFQNASTEFNVPVELLHAIAYVENNWTHIGPSIDRGWGIMHLVSNNYSNTLQAASRLINEDTTVLKDNVLQNIRGMASLLRNIADSLNVPGTKLEDWYEVAVLSTGLINREISEMHALRYYEVLAEGKRSVTLWDETYEIQAHPIDMSIVLAKVDCNNRWVFPESSIYLSNDYGPAIANFAPSCNYTTGRTHTIDTWVNHWVGTGTYAGAISWFHNCSSQVSAHFVIRSSDGQITQTVAVANTAWHCGAVGYPFNNSRSIGIEHEATAANPSLWNSYYMLNEATTMAKHFCNQYSIPKTRALPGIRGHNEMPGTATACPGSLPWSTWIHMLTIQPLSPANNANNISIPVSFQWNSSGGGNPEYRIQVSTTNSGWTSVNGFTSSTSPSNVVRVNQNIMSTSSYSWTSSSSYPPIPNTTYYWTVKVFEGNSSYYTPVRYFTTAGGSTTYTITTSSNPSAGGTTTGSGTFSSGSSRTVTATANSGYTFTNWTENSSVVSTSSSYTFTLNSNRNLVANFALSSSPCLTCPSYDLSITPNSGWQTHNSSFGSNGCKIYRIPVPSTPGYSYTFKTGCGDGATAAFDTYLELYNNNCSLLLDDDDGCESNRSIITWTSNYTSAQYIYLKVRGYSSNSSGSYTLAYLRVDPVVNYTITTSSNPSAGGTTTGSGTFSSGSSRTVSATANSGYTFTNWTENSSVVSTNSSYTFTLNSNRNLVANFTCNLPSSVTVNGGGTFCNSATLTASGGSGGTIYWQGTSNNGTSTSTPSTIQTVTSSGTYYYRAYNTCGWGTQGSATVTINTVPAQPGTISGNSVVCQGSSQTYSVAAVSGATSYSWSLPSGWTGSSTTNSITVNVGSSGGTLSVSANNNCGTGTARTLAISVTTLPAQPGTISGNSAVCQGSSQTYSVAAVSGATSYSWSLPSGWTGSSTTNSITVNVGSSGGTLSVSANNNCGTGTARTLAISVTTLPAQPGTISGNSVVCQGSSQTYSVAAVSGATSYSWSLPSGWTGSSTTNSITVNVGSSGGTLSVSANNNCGTGTARTLAISVTTLPAQPGTISGNSAVCQGSSQTYSVAAVSGATSYYWTLPSGWTGSSTTNSITVNVGSSGGTLSVSANNNCGTGTARTLAISVTTLPAQPGTISGNSVVCQGTNQTYSVAAVSGATSYSWTLPSGWTGSSTTNSITVNVGSSGGTLSVSANNNCGTGTARTLAISVTTLPAQPGTISGNSVVCQGSSQTYSVAAVSGATSYSWTLPSGWTGSSTTNSITVNVGSSGGTLSVSANNNCGTGTVRTLAISVTTLPAQPGTISGNSAVCQGSSQTYSVAAVSGATSYSWSLPSGWTGSSTTNSITVNVGPSGGTLSVSANNNCGTGTARTLAISVTTLPAQPGTISGNSAVCQGSSQTYSVAAVSGATSYSWSLPSGWTGSSTTNSITVNVGSSGGTLSVSANNNCGTGTARTLAISVTTLPTQPGTISGNSVVCQGSSQTYSVAAVSGATSYSWSLPSGWTGSSTTNSITVNIGSSGGTLSVSANNNCGTGTARTLAISVTTLPAQPGTISGNSAVCQGSSQTYSVPTVTGATSYTWTLPSGWSGSSTTNSITVTVGSTGGTLSVAAVNSCGTGTARTLAISVTTPPSQPGTISGNSVVCQGTTQTYSVAAVSGATSYSWSLPSGWTGSSTTNSITVTVGSSGGTLSVSANNNCGAGTQSMVAISVTTLPAQPGTISGNSVVCQGTTQTYSVAAVSGATSYSWTLPSGWTGSSSTNTITVTVGSSGGTLSVSANNNCGTGTVRTLAISVTTLPAQPGTISGNSVVCQGSSQTYSVAAVSGATSYSWTLPSGWTGNSNTNSITVTVGSSGGTLSVSANNTCGTGTARTLAISVTTLPSQPGTISGNSVVCQGTTQTYSVASVSGATSYTWAYTGGGTISGSGASTSFAPTTSGTLLVVANNACGTSTASILGITVNTIPTQPGTISGNSVVCQGTLQTYSVAAVSGATSYSWTLPSGWTGSSNTNSITVTVGSSGGTLSVSANNNCGTGTARTLAISVTTLPAQPGTISGNSAVCQGSSQTYSVPTVTGATSYTWTLPSGWSGSSTTNSITVTVGSTGGTLSVAAVNSCGTGTARTLAISVTTLPAQPGTISGNSVVCQGTSQTYSVAAVSGATSYSWSLPSGWTGSSNTNSINVTVGSSGGTLSVSANNNCGAGTPSMVAISVTTLPAQPGTISGNSVVCQGTSQTYSVAAVSGATSYSWSLPSGWTGSSTTNSITVTVGSLGGSLSVVANNSCGVGIPTFITINSITTPSQPIIITGNSNVCHGDSQLYTINPISTASSYYWSFSGSGSITGSGNNLVILQPLSSGLLSVVSQNVCGNSNPQTMMIHVSSPPVLSGSIVGPDSVCNTQTGIMYSIIPMVGVTGYIWTTPTGFVGSSSTHELVLSLDTTSVSGLITISAINQCGISNQMVKHVTLHTPPATAGSISGSTQLCQGQSNLMFFVSGIANATSYLWSLPAGAGGYSFSDSIIIGLSPNYHGTGVITVAGVNWCGIGSPSSLMITINEVPSKPNITVNGNVLLSNAQLGNQWHDQQGVISGATNQYYIASQSGIYYSIVTLAGCSSDTSNAISITTGIEYIKQEDLFRLYPNPVNDNLFIDCKSCEDPVLLEVYNTIGQLILKSEFNGSSQIATGHWPQGLYYVKLRTADLYLVKQFIRSE